MRCCASCDALAQSIQVGDVVLCVDAVGVLEVGHVVGRMGRYGWTVYFGRPGLDLLTAPHGLSPCLYLESLGPL